MNESPKRHEAEKAVGQIAERPDIDSTDTSMGPKEDPKSSLGGWGVLEGALGGPRGSLGGPWGALGGPWGILGGPWGSLGGS